MKKKWKDNEKNWTAQMLAPILKKKIKWRHCSLKFVYAASVAFQSNRLQADAYILYRIDTFKI